MKAAIYRKYGAADVVRVAEVPAPVPGPGEILVRVAAAGVTTGDWRLRAAAFPGIMVIPGRLMFGIRGPRKPVLGHEFAGQVAACGDGVRGFAPGDQVFGLALGGAHAEFLTMPATGAVALRPPGLSAVEAAALPFGALSALVFLRDVAKLRHSGRVAIIGASGGVGAYAVQIAKALGAEVTGVASTGNAALVRSLGADHFVDYRREDIVRGAQTFDVILDTVGALNFREARKILAARGLFVPLNFGLKEVLQALWSGLRGGKRIVTQISGDAQRDVIVLADMVRAGTLKPVIQATLPLECIEKAYALVESRHRSGAVVLEIAPPAARLTAA